jgi:hypothetical protein
LARGVLGPQLDHASDIESSFIYYQLGLHGGYWLLDELEKEADWVDQRVEGCSAPEFALHADVVRGQRWKRELGVHVTKLADRTIADHFAQGGVHWMESVHEGFHRDKVSRRSKVDQIRGLSAALRERLFQQQVFSGAQDAAPEFVVEPHGKRHVHGMNVSARYQRLVRTSFDAVAGRELGGTNWIPRGDRHYID